MSDKVSDNLPTCDTNDPADLAAWFGSFGFSDHWRKVVLANCREMVRATNAVGATKISEARIDDLARVSPNYLEFLTDNLHGRRLYEKEVRSSMRQV